MHRSPADRPGSFHWVGTRRRRVRCISGRGSTACCPSLYLGRDGSPSRPLPRVGSSIPARPRGRPRMVGPTVRRRANAGRGTIHRALLCVCLPCQPAHWSAGQLSLHRSDPLSLRASVPLMCASCPLETLPTCPLRLSSHCFAAVPPCQHAPSNGQAPFGGPFVRHLFSAPPTNRFAPAHG